jgi:type II secretory pathway pseudopilin PulG
MNTIALKNKGYSLIELLLYITIVGTLLFTITLFFGVATDSRIKNQTISEVDQQGKFILDTITQHIRNADRINIPTVGATTNQLDIDVFTPARANTKFQQIDNKIQITRESLTSFLNSDLVIVSDLQFQNLARSSTPGIVRVSFIINRYNPSNRNVYDYQKLFVGSAALRQ